MLRVEPEPARDRLAIVRWEITTINELLEKERGSIKDKGETEERFESMKAEIDSLKRQADGLWNEYKVLTTARANKLLDREFDMRAVRELQTKVNDLTALIKN